MGRLALLLPFLALGAVPQTAFLAQDLLPAETLLFAETPSAAAFRETFKKTPLQGFLQDEEILTFAEGAFAPLLESAEGFKKDVEKELGLPWEKLWELPVGQIALAVPTVAQDK